MEGTPEAVRKEMRSVLDGMRGGGTDAMRAKLREVAGAVQADRESGASHEAMLRLSQLGGQRG